MDNSPIHSSLVQLPFWLLSPNLQSGEIMARQCLNIIGQGHSISPTRESAWKVYLALTKSNPDAANWSDTNTTAWLFVAAIKGQPEAITKISNFISGMTEEDVKSYLHANPTLYPLLGASIQRGEWKKLKAGIISNWETYLSDTTEMLNEDRGWEGDAESGPSVSWATGNGYDKEVINSLVSVAKEDPLLQENLCDVNKSPALVVVADFPALTPQAQEVKDQFSNLIGRRLPFAADIPSLAKFKDNFLRKFPWAQNVCKAVMRHLAFKTRTSSMSASIPALPRLLLVGPSGAGKTAMLEYICELVSVPTTTISAGGASDDRGLSGVAQKWSSRAPCIPLGAMSNYGCCDPAIIINELEKSGNINLRNGSVQASLLDMLQPPSTGYLDACLNAPIVLDGVSFLASANSLHGLDPAILSRFEVIHVARPDASIDNFWALLNGVALQYEDSFSSTETLTPILPDQSVINIFREWVSSKCDIRALQRAYQLELSDQILLMDSLDTEATEEKVVYRN
ncbi:AAA family ATPase [Acetobacter pasteurianus]|uniref:AAA family ATPase n=1 Tax=Acetobacter pasteurianus TaxID=438 RepID=UPI000F54E7BE|nr:AAA family ATPase [Acetobacter pasteurianus]